MGVSTGITIGQEHLRRSQGYKHWSFKPTEYERDVALTKKQKNNPVQPTE